MGPVLLANGVLLISSQLNIEVLSLDGDLLIEDPVSNHAQVLL